MIQEKCNYYVDEAGDGTLFDKKGRILLGLEGCSNYFILGLLHVADEKSLSLELTKLRSKLLKDPYFKDVPSMKPEEKKTSIVFHAKDDLPEIRREVFAILAARDDLRFYAVIRDKAQLLSYVQQRNRVDSAYHYNPNELYDYLVRRLFRDRLQEFESYKIFFAKRGSSDRSLALQTALNSAQERYGKVFNKKVQPTKMEINQAFPRDCPSLQATDYFLWSLQRLFEKGEDRYVSLLWRSFRLVIDMDDLRKARYGTYYDKKKPLTSEAVQSRKQKPGI